MTAWRRLRRIFRPDVPADVDDELRFHLDARIAEYEARGVPRSEAEQMAQKRFGDSEGVRQTLEAHDAALARREYRWEYMSDLIQDVRIALRGLQHAPGFALTVLATLAIGIGANTAVFSVVSRVLLDPLPYRASGELVLLYSTDAHNHRSPSVSANAVSRMQQANRAFAGVAAFGQYGGLTYTGPHETVTWSLAGAGPRFFQTLGVTPALGRLIDARDVVSAGDSGVLVLSYAVWQQDFGGDSTIVGRTLHLSNSGAYTVIGITPRNFVPPARAPQVWVPLPLQLFLNSAFASQANMQALGRLAPGTSLEQAQAQLRVLSYSTDAPGGATAANRSLLTAVPIRDAMVGDVRPILEVVMGAALLVLLLACVNVAGLFFARSAARRREMAVRAALGAGNWRLVRQVLTETLVLGLAGGLGGIILAFWIKNALVNLGSGVLPATGAPIAIDARALIFALIASLAAGVTAGLAPALLDARVDPNASLGDGSRGATGSPRTRRIGRALVAGQMALAVVLLIGATLLTRTLVTLEHTSLGYSNDQHVLTFSVSLPSNAYPDWPQRSQFFTEWLTRLRGIPGVRTAGMALVPPWLGWNHWWVRVDNPSRPGTAVDSASAPLARVSDGYFAAVGTPVLAGRGVLPSDRPGSLPVAVVSREFADRWWPKGNAIGGRVLVVGIDTTWRTVVGIVGDVRETPSSAYEPGVYVPAWQVPRASFYFAVRSDGNAADLVPDIRSALRELDPNLPVVGPRTMDQFVSKSLAGQRLPMLLMGAFALLAVALAALGMYGMVAYAVALRKREMGIRSALGGTRGAILVLVLRDGLRTALIGTLIGMAIAITGVRLLAGLLFGMSPYDPVSFAAAAVVLLTISGVACLVPARRAMRVNPVQVLQSN